MLFDLAKLFWTLVNPAALLLLLLGAALLCLLLRRRRTALWLLAGALVLAALPAVTPVERWLLRPLESRFAALEPPERVAGIVVLGGGLDVVTATRGAESALNGAGERLLAAVRLARRYPGAELVYASGARWPATAETSEAELAVALLVELGVAPARLRAETRSRNTRENAAETFALVAPAPGETWLLVTSAFHMPRAMASFRAAGWDPLAYPVDHKLPAPDATGPQGWFGPNLLDRQALFALALKEYAGLLAYRLLGWSEEIFPAPKRSPLHPR